MNQMFNLLRSLDLYGTYFNFRINDAYKFKTEQGGVLSLLTFGVFIALICIFGESFFTQQNPTCSYEKGIFKNSEIPLYNKTEGIDEESNYLFILLPTYITNQNSLNVRNIYGEKNTIESAYIKPSSLTMEEFAKIIDQSKLKFLYSEYTLYSIALKSYYLGSKSSSDKNSGFLQIQIIPCDEISGVATPIKCNSTYYAEKKKKNPNTYAILFIPRIGFQKESKNKPLYEKYVQSDLSIAIDTKLEVNYDLMSSYVYNDDGWFISNEKIFSRFGLNSINLNTQPFVSNQQLKLFINIYVTDSFDKYSRIYVKIQDLLAGVFSIMKFVFSFIEIINMILRMYKIDLYVVNKYFTYELPSGMKPKDNGSDSNTPYKKVGLGLVDGKTSDNKSNDFY